MNKAKKEPLLLDTSGKETQGDPGSKQYLRALAKQLSAIAEELRSHDDGLEARPANSPMLPDGSAGNAAESDLITKGRRSGVSRSSQPNVRDGEHSLSEPVAQPSMKAISSDAGLDNTNGLRQLNSERAREAYSIRRGRAKIFGNEALFGEPAWDILLDLYIADVEDKPVSVSSACIGSGAPATTGLRWLGILAEEGLIVREHDPEDQRRVLVRMTERGLTAMDRYFASAGISA